MISVCFPFICLRGDVVISVDTTGTAAPQSEQQHIKAGRGKMVTAIFIHAVALERDFRVRRGGSALGLYL